MGGSAGASSSAREISRRPSDILLVWHVVARGVEVISSISGGRRQNNYPCRGNDPANGGYAGGVLALKAAMLVAMGALAASHRKARNLAMVHWYSSKRLTLGERHARGSGRDWRHLDAVF